MFVAGLCNAWLSVLICFWLPEILLQNSASNLSPTSPSRFEAQHSPEKPSLLFSSEIAVLINLLAGRCDLQASKQSESSASELDLSHSERKRGPGQAQGASEFRNPSKTPVIVWRSKRSPLSWLLPVMNGWAGGSAPQEWLRLRKREAYGRVTSVAEKPCVTLL